MSGNRANAAARQRRAGGASEMQGRGPVPGQGGRQMAPPPMPPSPGPGSIPPGSGSAVPKQMTVQNAVALISLRLSRVETIVQKFENEEMPIGGGAGGNENSQFVDRGVFDNIVSRLDALERGHKLLAAAGANKQVLATSAAVPAPAPVPSVAAVTKLEEKVESLKAEMVQVKDLLLKLQSFTMETNQKLVDMVSDNMMMGPEGNDAQDTDADTEMARDVTSVQNVDVETSTEMNNVNATILGASLKDLIQRELAGTDISELVTGTGETISANEE